jgi:hypothetical protein
LDAEAEVDATMDAPYYDESPLGFGAVSAAEPSRPAGKKVTIGIIALLVVAAIGLLIGMKFVQSAGADNNPGSPPGSQAPNTATTGPGGDATALALNANQVRIVDPGGDRQEIAGSDKIVDGDLSTAWRTQHYKTAKFGNIKGKTGMGVLINLGEPKKVSVEVTLSAVGASADMRAGSADPGSTKTGDQQILATYQVVGQQYVEHPGTKMVFTLDEPAQYLLVWFTSLPKDGDGYQVGVQEIVVHPLG